MTTHLAFLRGMNVGGHRITNSDLERHIRELGIDDVGTYQASGNVLIGAAPELSNQLEAMLSVGLEAALGYAVPVMVRSTADVRRIADHQPFGRDKPEPGCKPQVIFLGSPPDETATAAVLEHATRDDRVAVDGSEIYWWPKFGISESSLDVRRIEKLVGSMTVRTHATVQRLAAKL